MQIPQDVFVHDGILQWREVCGADGYNIHSGAIYIDTVVGQSNTSYQPAAGLENLMVSAWVRELHTPKSESAVAIPITKSDDMELIVDERFETLDNWTKEFPYWGPEVVVNNELQIYEPDAFTLTDNGVTINALKRGTDEWTSGCLKGKIENSYVGGLFKCRAQFDTVSGFLAAFWLLNTKYVDLRPEIDIFEHINDQTGQTYHYWNPEHNQISNLKDRVYGMNDYSLLWEPGEKLTWMVNDIPVFSTTENVSDQPMYPIFTLAVGGNWPFMGGYSLDPELESAQMHIESFQVWQ